ncbi:hypothetical protein FF38_14472 [Lucilia cuprina]|uniref:Uncharacterized protein n=1 Tax=Lucilia cuprina TaxID=7375 RepID=A0A0L0C156_LUCCU|nr:hypothetical protein FF38_14472 [Lucilia cuprina]
MVSNVYDTFHPPSFNPAHISFSPGQTGCIGHLFIPQHQGRGLAKVTCPRGTYASGYMYEHLRVLKSNADDIEKMEINVLKLILQRRESERVLKI